MSNDILLKEARGIDAKAAGRTYDLVQRLADALEAKPETDRETLAQALWESNHAHIIRSNPSLYTWDRVKGGDVGVAYRAKIDSLYKKGAIHLPVPVAETKTEWGTRHRDVSRITIFGTSKTAAEDAIAVAEDDEYRAYKRTIIYSPWESVS